MVMMVEAEATRVLAGPSDRAAEGTGTGLAVEREDICFYNVAADRLRIEVKVQNMSDTASNPEPMMLQFAAFGAFVPWTPLQLLQVPRIRPGGSTLVSTEVVICEDGTLLAEDGGAYSEDRKRYQTALGTIQDDEQLKTMSAWQVVARKVRNLLAENRVKRLRGQRETARKAQERASENRGLRLRLGDTSLAEFEELFELEPADRPRADLHQGRSVYWIGNITATPPVGPSPRSPLVIAEVSETGPIPSLKKSTVSSIDGPPLGEDGIFSNFSLSEDRQTHKLNLYMMLDDGKSYKYVVTFVH